MKVLNGIKVLDLTRVVAGPWATQTLADLGADVVKIERPETGEETRRIGPFLKDANGHPTDDSAFFLSVNRNKRSVTVDITSEAGAALIRDLARQCDVLVENHKVGSLKRYGLDYDSICAVNPSIIYCSVTGFGQDGPYAKRPAYDSIMQAMSGMMSVCGTPEGEPMRSGIPITDIVAGLYATIAIQAALAYRAKTGEGQYIDCAMIDTTVALNGHLALGYLMSGKAPTRQGNSNPVAAPSEVFPVADGHFMLAVGNDSQFRVFCDLIGCSEWAQDERFSTNAQRLRNRQALRAMLLPIMQSQPLAHWVEQLATAKIPGGPINDMPQVFQDPQVLHRGLLLNVPHASGSACPTLRSPIRFSKMDIAYRAAPTLGQHTQEVLGQWLGLSDEQIDALHQSHTI